MENPATITSDQIRMAKGALAWSNPDLSRISGLHRNTINRVERGKGARSTLELLRRVFEEYGVIFLPKNGGPPGIRFDGSRMD
jgi:transcriptional regulator with XRE-family HTH domain